MFIAEAATHKQIDYVEIDDVKYGFVASTDKRHGLMRFKPGAKKEYEKSCGVIVCIGYMHLDHIETSSIIYLNFSISFLLIAVSVCSTRLF